MLRAVAVGNGGGLIERWMPGAKIAQPEWVGTLYYVEYRVCRAGEILQSNSRIQRR